MKTAKERTKLFEEISRYVLLSLFACTGIGTRRLGGYSPQYFRKEAELPFISSLILFIIQTFSKLY